MSKRVRAVRSIGRKELICCAGRRGARPRRTCVRRNRFIRISSRRTVLTMVSRVRRRRSRWQRDHNYRGVHPAAPRRPHRARGSFLAR